MDVPRLMTRGIELLGPILETSFGPVPDFEVRQHDTPLEFGSTVNVYGDIERQLWYMLYHAGMLQDEITEGSYAPLWHDLTHERLHINNMERLWANVPWSERAMATFMPRGSSDDKCSCPVCPALHWVEGAVELAAVGVSLSLVQQGKADSLVRELAGDEVIPDESQDLEEAVAASIAYNIALLVRNGRLSAPRLELMRLPFEVPQSFIEAVDYYADYYVKSPIADYAHRLPYALGTLRCARIVSSGQMSVQEMLMTPLRNTQLKRMSDSAAF